MLGNKFKEVAHNHSTRVDTKKLEKQLVQELVVLKVQEQELREKQEMIAAHNNSLSKQFSAQAEDRNVVGDALVQIVTPDMSVSAGGVLGGLGIDMLDTLSSYASKVLNVGLTKADLISTMADARDNLVGKRAKPSMGKMLDKDTLKQSNRKGKALASANKVEGVQQRLELLEERLEQVQEAKRQGHKFIEVDKNNGIQMPETIEKQVALKKKLKTGYKVVQPKAMAQAM